MGDLRAMDAKIAGVSMIASLVPVRAMGSALPARAPTLSELWHTGGARVPPMRRVLAGVDQGDRPAAFSASTAKWR
jgi:hypothetical protein